MDAVQLEELNIRLDKLEKRDIQDLLTLLEIMSNVHFFGGLKKSNCEYAKDGQCSLFYLRNDAKNRIPVASDCKITGCSDQSGHFHLEVSNVTCTFCPQWNNNQPLVKLRKIRLSRRKRKRLEV